MCVCVCVFCSVLTCTGLLVVLSIIDTIGELASFALLAAVELKICSKIYEPFSLANAKRAWNPHG